MKLLLTASLFLIGLIHVLCVPSPPSYGNSFHLSGSMALPYAGIVEPLESWYDGNAQNMRTDYYGGLDSYIFRSSLNVTWQVNPVMNVATCFATNGPVQLAPYMPDLTNFVFGGIKQVNNIECNNFVYTETVDSVTSYYNFYADAHSSQPVMYQMMGYDSLLGSHYDLYQLTYDSFDASPIDPAIFNQPNEQCGPFPGPGVTMGTNPLEAFADYAPGRNINVVQSFSQFVNQHNKKYESQQEALKRQSIFHNNLRYIHAHNRKFVTNQVTYSLAPNHLLDRSDDEIRAHRGLLKKGSKTPSNADSTHRTTLSADALPTSVDWRQKGAVNPPQDQGVCGSCWSFGSTGAIEGAYFLKYGALHVFAEQQLMDCSWSFGNNACDGGEDWRAYEWVQQNGGISFKENYGPYTMADQNCQLNTPRDAVIASYVNMTGVDSLLDALATQGPISVSIDASHKDFSFYSTGVYYDPQCGNGPDDLDHSVLAVGYGTDPQGGDYWIVKNSWSTYWGDGGFVKMSRKDNNCGVATSPTYVVLQ